MAKEENPELADQPKFKGDWGFDEESARRAYAIYEVGKGHKHFVEMNPTTKALTLLVDYSMMIDLNLLIKMVM